MRAQIEREAFGEIEGAQGHERRNQTSQRGSCQPARSARGACQEGQQQPERADVAEGVAQARAVPLDQRRHHAEPGSQPEHYGHLAQPAMRPCRLRSRT
jgi:hypothetical protein